MGLLAGIRTRRAAKQYAIHLRPCLVKNWGDTDETHPYSVAQIVRAVVEAGLDPDFMVFGFAALLPKSEFEALLPQMRVKLPYESARAMFIEFEPISLVSRSGTPGPVRTGY